MLTGQAQLSACYSVLKMASMSGSCLPAIAGGIFAPSLLICAGFGNLLQPAFGDAPLSMLIALAMVGYRAAVTQSPITAFAIVMKMINGHALVISRRVGEIAQYRRLVRGSSHSAGPRINAVQP